MIYKDIERKCAAMRKIFMQFHVVRTAVDVIICFMNNQMNIKTEFQGLEIWRRTEATGVMRMRRRKL